MDQASIDASRTLAEIAESYDRATEFGHKLQAMPAVERVSRELDCYKNHAYLEYGFGPSYIYDWYVEAALKNGKAIWWYLEVQWSEQEWRIGARVQIPGRDSPETLQRFDDRIALTLDDFLREVREATSELLKSADLIQSQAD